MKAAAPQSNSTVAIGPAYRKSTGHTSDHHIFSRSRPPSTAQREEEGRRSRGRRKKLVMMGEEDVMALINHCCSLAMAAHRTSAASPFILHDLSSSTAVFAFPGSWSADDWLLETAPFGDSELDPSLFPSLRSIGTASAARVNGAFLRSFQSLLNASRLQTEIHKAVAEKKRVVFTGHSSGGSISVLATLWLLERLKDDNSNQVIPFCLTFGSPLVGDCVFGHALLREDWSRYFLHFVMTADIVPRILLAPLLTFKEEFQAILHFLCPRSSCFNLNSIGKSQLVMVFYSIVLRSAMSIASHRACLFMGCTSPLLEVIDGFTKLTPYRPFGTHAFCTDNSRLVTVKNSDAILQLLSYCLQLHPRQDMGEVARRSLQKHLLYESKVKECLEVQNIINVDCLKAMPLFLNYRDFDEMQPVEPMLEDLQLSMEARLCLRAAGEWEKQKCRNQAKIDANYSKIQEALDALNEYRLTCELRGAGYYDTFKLQKDPEDFNANVKRLELAGLWDEIVEMLRRYELPDSFEGRTEWVKLGSTYRFLVEPLDIANYYRHSKNEDTGPYMVKGRPKRYKYTQRWLEHGLRMPSGSSRESCFWAITEELCADTSSRDFKEVRERVVELEEELLLSIASGKLRRDVFMADSTFVKWWKTLPQQHRLDSRIAKFVDVENFGKA